MSIITSCTMKITGKIHVHLRTAHSDNSRKENKSVITNACMLLPDHAVMTPCEQPASSAKFLIS